MQLTSRIFRTIIYGLVSVFFVGITMVTEVQAATTTCPTFTQNLSGGSQGTQVRLLQEYLVREKFLSTSQVSGHFGMSTESALQRFQSAKGIVSKGGPRTTGYGALGPKTRVYIESQCANKKVVTETKATTTISKVATSTISRAPSCTIGVSPSTSLTKKNITITRSSVRSLSRTSYIINDTSNTFERKNKKIALEGVVKKKFSSAGTYTIVDTVKNKFGEATCSATVVISQDEVQTKTIKIGTTTTTEITVSPKVPQTIFAVTPSGVPYTLKSALEALKTVSTQVPQVTIALADGVYDMSIHSNDMCGNIPCITFNDIPNPSRLRIVGNVAKPEKVVLRFAKPTEPSAYWSGGFYLYENKNYGVIDGFTMEGPYNGWKNRESRTPDQTITPSDQNTTMAVWARNGARVEIGPHVIIRGFYFGVASEGKGTVVTADRVQVEQCGDAGFIVWNGATLYARKSDASWCAAIGWGLGAGYIAETADPHALARYTDSSPDTDDTAIRNYSYNYSKGFRSSVEAPVLKFVDSEINKYGRRSRLIATDARAHDNLVAGFVANVGGSMDISDSLAYRNGLGSINFSGPILKGGVIAQTNGDINAENVISYHNGFSGFAAQLGSVIQAANAKAYGNKLHGFNAIEQDSIIYADGASSFSYGASQQFGFGAERGAKIYTSATTKAGSTVLPFSFFDPLAGSRGDTITVAPLPNTKWDFSPTPGTRGNEDAEMIVF